MLPQEQMNIRTARCSVASSILSSILTYKTDRGKVFARIDEETGKLKVKPRGKALLLSDNYRKLHGDDFGSPLMVHIIKNLPKHYRVMTQVEVGNPVPATYPAVAAMAAFVVSLVNLCYSKTMFVKIVLFKGATRKLRNARHVEQ
jgi:hypothetical protein